MANRQTQEQAINTTAEQALLAVAKDKMSVAERYSQKYGTIDGEATEKEIEELIQRFDI